MDRKLSMSTTCTPTWHCLVATPVESAGPLIFMNCMNPVRYFLYRFGCASVFAALGFVERPNAVNRFACSRREVLFAT
jgi:hypothetical protein